MRSASSRLLGLVGILGGVMLLAAFLPFDFASGFNVLRIGLFNVGAMAIVIAVHRRQAAALPMLAGTAALPL